MLGATAAPFTRTPEPSTRITPSLAANGSSWISNAGYDVELLNWRGVVAPPGISDAERRAIVEFIDRMHSSEQWKQTLIQQGWADFYETGEAAAEFFKSESARIKTVLADTGVGS